MNAASVTAIILAGGRGTRMDGADKGLMPIHGRPLIEYILSALRPQVGRIVINANRNTERYAGYGYQVVSDASEDFQGPLAGIAAALDVCDSEWLLTVPCDSPLICPDLTERLLHAALREDAEIAVASDGQRLQPLFALIRSDQLPPLEDYLASGERKVERWYAERRMTRVDFSDRASGFLNLNSHQERAAYETATRGAT